VKEDGEHYKEIAALLSEYCTRSRKTALRKDKAVVSWCRGFAQTQCH